jgi:hypothetical protein
VKCEACRRETEDTVRVCQECLLSPAPVREELGELKALTEHHCKVMSTSLMHIENAYTTASVPDDVWEKTMDLIRTLRVMNAALYTFVAIGVTEIGKEDPDQQALFEEPKE